MHMKTNPLYKKMQEKSKLDKCKEAEQELNKLIDFYRDMTKTSYFRGANKEIKKMEKSLQYLVDNFDPKETVPFHPAHGNYKLQMKQEVKEFKLPEYYNTSKPKEEKKEPLKDRKCNLCTRVIPMTRFQRFCVACRSRIQPYPQIIYKAPTYRGFLIVLIILLLSSLTMPTGNGISIVIRDKPRQFATDQARIELGGRLVISYSIRKSIEDSDES